jgi:transposase
MKHYIGLDVSMKRTFICVINEQGKIVHEGSENTDPHLIADYLSKLGLEKMMVGFESGSLTPYLIVGFQERAIDAVCMDARKLSPILALKVNKTDKNDARGIAETLRSGMYTRVHCKPEESVNRAILLTARRTLIEQQTHLKNTVRSLLKSYGVRMGAISAKKFSATVMKRIDGWQEIITLSIKCLLDAFDKLVEEIVKIDKKMLEIACQDKEVRRFMTIPRVGPITTMTYKAEIFDATHFKESRSVGAYLGMTPTQYASGETQRQGKTSKCGTKELRILLVEAGVEILTRSKNGAN